MTRPLEAQLREDKAMRDAAYTLVRTDIAHLKADWAEKGIGARTVDRLKDGASEVYEEAVDVASDHRGVLAALLAAVGLWFARNPIMSLFLDDDEIDEEEADDDLYAYERY
ncbi:hypothetical protein [Qipengyuania atrilutea]|uniref:Uncharacterized protein n=1 Tax=Qipengyuania atrilutea TaxID=2744473 RepID=A0A850GZ39_9SPHN|nr:hypothetical protein [Actirhodobacter atriluteus]NVD43746.1 hypothetical protein [Actirhodobacter atriluteus]